MTGETGPELVQPTQGNLAKALLGAGSHLALTIGATQPLTANIDLSAFRALPTYNNLVYSAGEPEQTGRAELRICARVHADERIEFAVQQRTDDGWSDDILLRARIIPAFGRATIWLSSRPVSLNVKLDPPLTVVQPSPILPPAAEPFTPVLREGSRTASIFYDVKQLDLEGYQPTKLNAVLTAYSQQELQLQVGCFGDERQVLLTGVPSYATGDLTLVFDDAETNARWSVNPSDDSASLAPADVERTIQRLRRAQSPSVRNGHAAVAPTTFRVAGMFETPIQVNIDQCGNHTDPDWQLIAAPRVVLNDTGGYYGVYYREWNDFKRDSHVQIWAIDGGSPPGERPFTLLMTCNSQTLPFLIGQVPDVGNRAPIHLRVDDGERLGVPAAEYA